MHVTCVMNDEWLSNIVVVCFGVMSYVWLWSFVIIFVISIGKVILWYQVMYGVERLVKRIVNCILRKYDGFKRVKVDQWNGMRTILNCMIVWGFAF